jgi:hypothetical protein
MKRVLSIVLASAALAATAAAQDKPHLVGTWKLIAQDKPDFVGTWKLVGDAADMFTATQIVVAKNDTVLTVTTTGQMGEFKTDYKLDGTAGSSPLDFQGNTIDRTTKATWNENKLTLTATSDMNGQSFEVKSVVSGGPDGTMIVETTFPDFQGGGAPVTIKSTYKKG